MNLNIPSQFRQEFDRSVDFAVEKEDFTPSELAEYLGRGRLPAEMMIRYMEKAELVTKGKGDDLRHARITPEEWDAIGRRLENYVPVPEPVKASEPEEVPEPPLTVADIIAETLEFNGRTLFAEEGLIVIEDGEGRSELPLESISAIFMHRGRWLGKSTLTFSTDGATPEKAKGRRDTVTFKKRDWDRVKELADSLAERLETEVKLY